MNYFAYNDARADARVINNRGMTQGEYRARMRELQRSPGVLPALFMSAQETRARRLEGARLGRVDR